MGLKNTVRQIAIKEALKVVSNVAPNLVKQMVQTGGTYTGSVIKVDGNTITIKNQLGEEQTLTYLGDRILGADSVVVVQGDFAL